MFESMINIIHFFASLNGESLAAYDAAVCYSQISDVTKNIEVKRNLGFELEKYTLSNLWVSISMPSAGALLWVKRIAENNDSKIKSSDFGENTYCLDVARYYMGSNCRLFDPYEPEWEFD